MRTPVWDTVFVFGRLILASAADVVNVAKAKDARARRTTVFVIDSRVFTAISFQEVWSEGFRGLRKHSQ
jgi:hypothetical protein